MPKKGIHPQMYNLSVETVNKVKFVINSTLDNGGKVFFSDFDVAWLPWNRTGAGVVTERDAVIQRFRKRQGGMVFSNKQPVKTAVEDSE